MRLIKFKEQLKNLPLYVLPVQHKFLFEEGEIFDKLVADFIKNFKKESIE